MRKSSGSYQREKQRKLKGRSTKRLRETFDDAELAALVQLRDEDIDTSDIPERTDWTGAVIGKFYRPIKEAITVRLDADLLAWLKSEGPGYQTRLNALLRTCMTHNAKEQALRRLSKAETEPPILKSRKTWRTKKKTAR